jgi:mannose-6-phosphate isomerase
VVAGGLIADELSTDRATTKPSHRVWPHTEAIKAAATRHAGGDTSALGFAQQMAEGLLGTFLDRPFAGGWIDHVSAERTSLVDYVPASTLYHLALAASVAAKGFAGAPDLAKAGS